MTVRIGDRTLGIDMTSMRLAWRLHRFEMFAFTVLILGLSAGALIVAGWMDATGYGQTCLDPTGTSTLPPSCAATGAAFFDLENRLAGPIAVLLVIVSYAAAALIGVAVIARELERGTTRLAWSLAPSRWRWYARRIAPILAVLIGLTFIAGIATDRLASATLPGVDVANAFADFGQRGGLIAARSVFIFAVAVLAGALIGRSLPALIVAAVVAGVGLAGGEEINGWIVEREAIVVPDGQERPGDLFLDQRFRLPDGSLVGWDVIDEIDPPPSDGSEWIPKYPMVSIVVPGDRYRFVEAREAVALLGGSIVALGLGGLVVSRRRPD